MAAEWPRSGSELKELGYVSQQKWTPCSGCGEPILFARTPQGGWMPLREVDAPLAAPEGERYFQPHFIDCPKSKRFQKKRARRT
jgi:hypothetical protein